MTVIYTKPQIDQMGVKIGQEIKKVKDAIPASGSGGSGGGDMTLDDGRVIKQRYIYIAPSFSGLEGRGYIPIGIDLLSILGVNVSIFATGDLIQTGYSETENIASYSYRVSRYGLYFYKSSPSDTRKTSWIGAKILITYLA